MRLQAPDVVARDDRVEEVGKAVLRQEGGCLALAPARDHGQRIAFRQRPQHLRAACDGDEVRRLADAVRERTGSLDAILVLSVGGGDPVRGVSTNLVRAIEYARAQGAAVCGIVGRDGTVNVPRIGPVGVAGMSFERMHAALAERFSGFLEPFARRTNRLASKQRQVAMRTGGEAGAVVLQGLGLPVSPDTLLRLMRRMPESSQPPPRVIGVDDWAWRKGQRYGMLIVDLERRCPIDMLEDRSADGLVAWLQAHPSVEVISRDRGAEYTDGATRGAPDATRVADRWHLLQNLREALERLLDQHHECLCAAAVLPEAPSSEPLTATSDRNSKCRQGMRRESRGADTRRE